MQTLHFLTTFEFWQTGRIKEGMEKISSASGLTILAELKANCFLF